MTRRSGRTSPSQPILGFAKGAAAFGVCASLAACSAHERRSAAAPAAPQPVALAQATPGAPTADRPIAGQSATNQLAAATPANTSAPSAKAVASSDGAPAAVRKGKSGAGLASWYGDRFHGRKTANGERFDMYTLTAAHRSFPLPSYVRVTNVSNGRSIVVRVNDRGPFHGGRVIDVSKRAADVLGFRGHGVGNVKLDYVGRASSRSDDQRLLASYQEFGRPTLPPGMQVAAFTPVSDSEIAAGSSGSGGAYAIASRTVAASANYVMASATSAASSVRSVAVETASTARETARKLLPRPGPSKAAEGSETPQPIVAAYAAPQPQITTVPPAIAAGPTEPRAKRVVRPMEPALASATPPLKPPSPPVDVSSRIASSFDSFSPTATTVTSGASVSVETTR